MALYREYAQDKYRDIKRVEKNYDALEKQLEELSKDIRRKTDTELINKMIIEEVNVPRLQALPRMSEEPIKPLKREAPKILGTLFDRVEFMKERIDETNSMLDTRKQLHNAVIEEIDKDILEKSEIESRLADINEKRNFKLDISILRKEMRAENLQFWRDLLELRTELRELLEQYEVESKICNIFKELRGDSDENGHRREDDLA